MYRESLFPERYAHFLGFFLDTIPPKKPLTAFCADMLEFFAQAPKKVYFGDESARSCGCIGGQRSTSVSLRRTDDVCSSRVFLPQTWVMTMLLHALKLLGWLGFIGFVVLWFVPLGNERLYQAIDEGDEAQAIQLIKAGVNPNSTLGTYAPQFVDKEAVQGHLRQD